MKPLYLLNSDSNTASLGADRDMSVFNIIWEITIMARQGITEKDVAGALTALNKAGIGDPSIRMLHQKLGTGSLTTISRHKRAIEASQRTKQSGSLPDPVKASLEKIANEVWDQLSEAADQAIAKSTSKAELAISEHRDAKQAAEEGSEQAKALIADLTQSLADAEKRLKKSLSLVASTEKRLQSTLSDNKVLKAEIKQLHKANESQLKINARLEASQVITNEAVRTAETAHLAERVRWENRLDELQKLLEKKTGQIKEIDKRSSVLHVQVESLQVQNKQAKAAVDKVKKEQIAIAKEHSKQLVNVASLETALKYEKDQWATKEKTLRETIKKRDAELKKKSKKPRAQKKRTAR